MEKKSLYIVSSKTDQWVQDLCKALERGMRQLSMDLSVKCVDETSSEKIQADFIIFLFNENARASANFNSFCSKTISENSSSKKFSFIHNNFENAEISENLKSLPTYFFQHKKQGNSKNYWLNVLSFLYEIKGEGNDANHDKAVFVAHSDFDQSTYRLEIIRELSRHGYKVLQSDKSGNELKALLSFCALSIHLIDTPFIDENENAISVKQHRAASEYATESNNDKFYRFIWMPTSLKVTDEKQATKIEKLKKDIEALRGAEIVQTPIEVLKSIVLQKLHQKNNSETTENTYMEKAKSIYLMYELSDKHAVQPIIDSLSSKQVEVMTPSFSGDQLSIIRNHRNNLVSSQACVIFSQRNNQRWVNSKIKDILKSPGFGKAKPFKFKAIMAETIDEKQNLPIQGIKLYSGIEKKSSELLQDILSKLN